MVYLNEAFVEDLKSLLRSLQAHRGQYVIVGGVANYLFHLCPEYSSDPATEFTKDIDLAVPEKIPAQSESLKELLKGAGFEENSFPVLDAPPHSIMKFVNANGTEIELLCPLHGPELEKDGTPKYTKEIQAGITAQPLRYLDILLHEPITVQVGGELATIPNPGAYFVQKFLTISKRPQEHSREKDSHYLFELILGFRDQSEYLVSAIEKAEKHFTKSYKAVRSFRADIGAYFSDENSIGIQRIVAEKKKLAGGKQLPADAVYRIVQAFLKRIPAGET